MNWVRQNRFLAGFLAALLLGAGGLVYLLVSSYGRYDQVNTDYQTQVAELQRLQKLEPYPDQENLKKYEDIRKNYAASVTDLQARLAALEPAPENPPPTPLQFQDRLRRVVEESVRTAQTAGIELPKDYYLGFEQYRSTPPDAAATPLLSAELNAVDGLVGTLLQKHAVALTAIKRGLLPQEAGGTAAAAPTPPAPGARPGAAPAAPLVGKQALELSFTALPSSLREILNEITTSKRLYLVRALQVKNQVDQGPSRNGDKAPGAPGSEFAQPTQPAAPADPNAPPLPANAPPPLRYVVGQEKLDVVMRVEIARVQPPAPAVPTR